jgi:hypothetical protein
MVCGLRDIADGALQPGKSVAFISVQSLSTRFPVDVMIEEGFQVDDILFIIFEEGFEGSLISPLILIP